ncbi:MAG: hypothetical protein CM15mP116_08520 [Synechococcus sp.]|nr:MAG: hypothetical protein CM15mP116_08520 [Synechococcus sp.]
MPLIQEAVTEHSRPGVRALRLNWSRGSSRSGDRTTTAGAASVLADASALATELHADSAHQSLERRNCDSVLSRCKTFAYGQAVQAGGKPRNRAAMTPVAEHQGRLCCSTTANLLLKRGTKRSPWLTPPLEQWLPAGVMRARALQLGLAVEAELGESLGPDDQLLLINSLSCRGVLSLDHQPLAPKPRRASRCGGAAD